MMFASTHKMSESSLSWFFDTDAVPSQSEGAAYHSVLRLHSWPDLVSLPDELLSDVARVCALLAIRPSANFLLPQLSGLPKTRCTHIVHGLHLGGHLGASAEPHPGELALISAKDIPSTEEIPTKDKSLLARLWRRLGGGS